MTLDYDRLFKLRLVIARIGEMDRMAWWNTKGILGPLGAVVYGRGFPRTAPFAAARAVFAVARARTVELWNPVGCATLWSLPPEIEDAFEDHWQRWTDQTERWRPFFDAVAKLGNGSIIEELHALGLLDARIEQEARELRRSVDNRAVLLPGIRAVDDLTIGLLGAGFFRGQRGELAVPYARLEG